MVRRASGGQRSRVECRLLFHWKPAVTGIEADRCHARSTRLYRLEPKRTQRQTGTKTGRNVESDLSTTQLVIASKQGNNEALGQLLEQYRGYLLMLAHRYLSERLRRRVDPSDVVQLTFLEAKRDLPAFRGETPAEFAGWLRGMLKNNVATAVTRHVTTQKRSLRREVDASPPAGKDSAAGG